MSREKGTANLISNTFIYMVGMSLSKVMNFFILPYISKMINSESFGVYDIIQSIASLLVPIITLQIVDAAFRFMFNKENAEKSKVLTNVWVFIILGIILFLLIGVGLNSLFFKRDYFEILCVYTISTIFLNMFQRVARSYDAQFIYALSGVIQTVVLMLSQIAFMTFTDTNETGLVYAYLVSVIVSCIYIEVNLKSLRNINYKLFDRGLICEMLKFSAPLVPNSISWWAVSSIGRIIIISVLGYTANGIYSMSNKFAGLITMITSTFLLAFQEYLLSEKNSEKQSLNSIYNIYVYFLAFGTSVLVLLQQIYFKLFIDAQYSESILYIPVVMMSMFFSSIASFYGTGYFAYKKTAESLKTTLFGAGINILLCLISINHMGLWGVAISGVIGYLSISILRHFTMKKYFCVKLRISNLVRIIGILLLSVFIYYVNNVLVSLIVMVVISAYTLFGHRKILTHFVRQIRKNSSH